MLMVEGDAELTAVWSLQGQECCLEQWVVLCSSMFALRTSIRPSFPTTVTPSLGWNYSSASLVQKMSKLAWREASWPSFLAQSIYPTWSGHIILEDFGFFSRLSGCPTHRGCSGSGARDEVTISTLTPWGLPLKTRHLSGLTCNMLKHLHQNVFRYNCKLLSVR